MINSQFGNALIPGQEECASQVASKTDSSSESVVVAFNASPPIGEFVPLEGVGASAPSVLTYAERVRIADFVDGDAISVPPTPSSVRARLNKLRRFDPGVRSPKVKKISITHERGVHDLAKLKVSRLPRHGRSKKERRAIDTKLDAIDAEMRDFSFQGEDDDPMDVQSDLNYFKGLRANASATLNQPLVRYVEGALLLLFDLNQSTSIVSRQLAIARFWAHVNERTASSAMLDIVASWALLGLELGNKLWALFDSTEQREAFTPQSWLDTFDAGLNKFEWLYDHAGKLFKSPIVSRVKSAYIVLVAAMASREEGRDATREQINFLKKECEEQDWFVTEDPIEFLVRAAIAVLRAVAASYRLGKMSPLFGDQASIMEWFLESQDVVNLKSNIAILDIYQTNIHELADKLERLISKGSILVRVNKGHLAREALRTLTTLKGIKNDLLSHRAATELREPPFAILLHGGTSVAKSTLIDVLYTYIGHLKGLSTEEKFRYTRNSTEDHWNNFTSAHWCIVFDEIAPRIVTPNSDIDEATAEVLRVCNSVPYCPPQAALDDKGKTPCRAKLVLGTTNVMDLSVPVVFHNPTAIMRRFHLIVDISVKEEFRQLGNTMLDWTKTTPDAFPDYWNFTIYRAVPAPRSGVQMPMRHETLTWVEVAKFSNVRDFLKHVRDRVQSHEDECKVLSTSHKTTSNMRLCGSCRLPVGVMCECPFPDDASPRGNVNFQSEDVDLDEFHDVQEEKAESDGEDSDIGEAYTLLHSNRNTNPEWEWIGSEERRRTYWRIFNAPSTIYAGLERAMERMTSKARGRWRKTGGKQFYKRAPKDFMGPRVYHIPPEYYECVHMYYVNGLRHIYHAFGLRMLIWILYYLLLGWYGMKFGKLLLFHKHFHIGYLLVLYAFTSKATNEALRSRRNRILLATMVVAATTWVNWDSLRACLGFNTKRDAPPDVEIGREKDAPEALETQALNEKIANSPMNQKAVWYKDDYMTTSYEVGRFTSSWSKCTEPEMISKLQRNCARIQVWHSGGTSSSQGSAFCVGAKLWVTNAHFFRGWEDTSVYQVSLLFGGGAGVGQDMHKLTLYKSSIHFLPEQDLAYMWIDGAGPRRDLRPLLIRRTQQGKHRGFTLGFVREGSGVRQHVAHFSNATLNRSQVLASGKVMRIFGGHMDEPTQEGQCGRVAISMSPAGPMILGIHSVGRSGTTVVGFAPLYVEDVETIWREFSVHFISSSSIMLPEGSPTVAPELHEKSPVRFVEQGSVEIVGTVLGARSQPKSHFRYSKLARPLLARGWKLDAFKPPMAGWEPKYNVLRGIVDPDSKLEPYRLKIAAAKIANRVLRVLPPNWKSEMGVVDLATALNGIEGVAHMDRINVSTSCGFPYGGPKKKFLSDPFGDLSGTLTLDPEIEQQVDYILGCWKEGELAGVVINAAFKDEPRTRSKVEAKKVRMFQVAPMAFTIAMRQLLLPFLRIFYNCHEAFFSAPGVDASSGEWDQVAQWLAFDGNLIDGDYGSFDSTMKSSVMDAIAHFVLKICDASDAYDAEQLLQIHCAILECCHIFLNFFGDLIRLPGMNSSGNAGTVVWNCFANLLFLYIAYEDLSPEGAPDFFECLRILLYGDDNIISVSNEVKSWFTFNAIRAALGAYGIEYTTADKQESGPDHKSLEEVEFLKRNFRFDEEIGHYVGALKRESIAKMVMCYIPSKTVHADEQLAQSIESAVREAFLHGREYHAYVCESLHAACLEIDEPKLAEGISQLNYDYLLSQYIVKSRDRDFFKGSQTPGAFKRPILCESVIVERLTPSNQTDAVEGSYCADLEQNSVRMDFQCKPPERSSKSLFSEAPGCCAQSSPPTSAMTPRDDGLKNRVNKSNIQFESDAATTEQQLDFQSEEVEVSDTKVETVVFSDEANQDHDGFKSHPIVSSTTDASSLGKFLSRPVQILHHLWAKNDPPATAAIVLPWYEFLNNPFIKNKIMNYSYIRGNLHVKVLVNATPFVFGAALMSYFPLSGYTRDTTRVPGLMTDYIMGRSQRPHVWIIPADCQGGELTLPFFYFRDFLELGSASFSKAMGALFLDTVIPLQTANGGAAPDVTIQVYAWMTEVELSGPTVGLTLQAKDEYLGPISAPASAVAAMARKMKDQPVIGRLATATEVGASAVATMSSLFGFSNVVDLNGSKRIVSNPVPEMANVGQSYPTSKLSLDPKNELTVDGRALGLPEADSMDMSAILSRESFVNYFGWAVADVSDKLLFCGRVTPRVYQIGTTAGTTVLSLTPMAWISKLFRHWRGDIIYKFKFIATPMHKGRVIISYDPTGTSTSHLANTADTTAAVQTYVVDLTTEREFEMRIPYSQATPWCKLQDRMSSSNMWADFAAPGYGYVRGFDNGTISMRVQTKLSSPDGATGIGVMVFVRGADNLEFANPGMTNISSEYLTPFVPQSEEDFGTSEAPAGRFLLNMGEQVHSLRALTQRRSRLTVIHRKTGSAGGQMSALVWTLGRTPLFPGYDTNGIHSLKKQDGTTTTTGNFANWHPLTWLWCGFAGNKGSIEYTIYRDGDKAASMRVYRSNDVLTPGISVLNATPISDSHYAGWYTSTTQSGFGGMTMMDPSLTPAANVSFTMYQSNKFGTNDPGLDTRNAIPPAEWIDDAAASSTVIRNATALGLDREFDNMGIEVRALSGLPCETTLDVYVSAGSDFSLLWFLNAPQVFVCVSPLAA